VDIYIQFDTDGLSIFFRRLELVMFYRINRSVLEFFGDWFINGACIYVEHGLNGMNIACCAIWFDVAIDIHNCKYFRPVRDLRNFRFH